MTVDEFKMVPLPPGSTVITIGCGSFPHTIFTLVRVRGWRFVAVDCDTEAVKNARKMVEKYHLEDMVEIREGEGLEADVSGFDLILVSHGVEPKCKILETLGKHMKQDGMIFYRTIWDKLEKVYGCEPIPNILRVKESYYRNDGIKSMLLVRNENPK
jgi:precorrin-6B methylase 2